MSQLPTLSELFKKWQSVREQFASPAAARFVLRCIESDVEDNGFIDVRDRYAALSRYADVLAAIRCTHFSGTPITSLERIEAQVLFLAWIADEAASHMTDTTE